MPSNRGMDKEDVVYIYSEMLLSIEQNKIMPFAATWMGLEIVTLSEISQTEKRQTPCDIAYTWDLYMAANEPIYKTEVKSHL